MLNMEALLQKLGPLRWVTAQSCAQGMAVKLTINRPDALNALNPEVVSELTTAFAAVHTSDVRCLVLTGAGDRAFVAGADIKSMSAMTPASARTFAKTGTRGLRQLEHLQCATIACVNGFALGGGLELALCCDMILASSMARVGLPEVSLGLIPGFGGTQRLARSVGLNKAREMIFSGNFYSAAQARDMGLVNQVYPPDKLWEETEKLATTICQRGPIAVKNAKQAILKGWDMDIDAALELEGSSFAELFGTQDQKEGAAAFLEKRPANFTGK